MQPRQIDIRDSYERTPSTEAVRSVLCVFAAGDPKRVLPRLDVDWEQVFKGVARNGLIGLTHYYLEQNEKLDFLPPSFREQIHRAHLARTVQMARLYQNIGRVICELEDSGIDFLVVKGPALAYGVYPDPALRAFNDLDIIVREQSWNEVYRLLKKLGFKQEENFPYPPPKLIPQLSPYESKYWHTKSGFLVEVHYEDLYNVGLTSRDVDGFWRRANKLNIENFTVHVPSLEDQLIHACMHAHYHGYTRLNWFSDLALIVRDHTKHLKWEQVIQTVQIEEAQTGVYYSLFFLERLLGISIPTHVLDAVRPDSFRRWWHERYLPAHRVLSLQPMPRPDFSFYFAPLFKRLIPDLLIMGRRREKLGYLLRLFIPPPNWLKNYYNLTDERTIALHYFLHPLKLFGHYLDEIIQVLLKKRPAL
jgi:hypothetical protein